MKLVARDRVVNLDEPVVMGILNVTPDSFAGDGVVEVQAAAERAKQMLAEGAGIIDVGGESSRPGAAVVSMEDELKRVLPVVRWLVSRTDAVISVDTYKPEVAEAALKAGAHIINDISGLRDEAMAKVVAQYGAGVVIMHMQGTPATMQVEPHYDDVVAEVRAFFTKRIALARSAGVAADRIMLDPGIGFGKNLEHNLALLGAVAKFREWFAQPLLVGASRKRFIGTLTGRAEPEDRVFGTAAVTALAVRDGANVVRVHDVVANVDAVKVARALAGGILGQ